MAIDVESSPQEVMLLQRHLSSQWTCLIVAGYCEWTESTRDSGMFCDWQLKGQIRRGFENRVEV